MRKVAILVAALVVVALLAACEDDPPPTQIYIVLSPTPETATPETLTPAAPTPTVTVSPTPQVIVVTATAAPTEPAPSATGEATPTAVSAVPTPLPPAFLTPVIAEVQLAEQVYQHGRMFWIRHNRQIWVMVARPDDPNGGDWYCYNDTFQEGEPEIDPNLLPPAEGLIQPRRGFGKLWRSHPELQAGLGWGITPEFELTSVYMYLAGGYVENGQYFPGPGEHRLNTSRNETVSFYEDQIRGDCQGGYWRLNAAP